MIVLCAWCEQEGRQALIHETEPRDQQSESHGMCDAHEQALLAQLNRSKEQIRHIPRRLSLPNARGNRSPITVLYL